MKTYAVIMAGGRGERFWPQSRRSYPKQFLQLFGKESLIQITSRRIAPVCPLVDQRFVIDETLGQVLRRQLRLRKSNFVFEPYGRNTAPALALAAAYIGRQAPESVMVVLPADHLIKAERKFQASVRLAVKVAQEGLLVTFGIPPDRPDTSYGYVEAGEPLPGLSGRVCSVRQFREKPDLKQAEEFLKHGGFWWNSGMFVWRTDVFLKAVEQFMPKFYPELMRFQAAIGTTGEKRALAKLYAHAEAISVDYAIMEPARNVAVVRADFDWDDVGSWTALERQFPRDAAGNVGLGEFVGHDSRDCMWLTDTGVVALLGCENLVVVRTPDAVFVAPKNRVGEIKKMLGVMAEDKKKRKYL